MATEKNSTLEERIENVAAPPAEPGAARLAIRRRDLLAGTALVLVGSASGCGPGTSNSQGSQQQPLRTQFVADFTAAFIGDPTKIQAPGQPDKWPDPGRVWPTSGQKQVDILADFATFANVLMTVGYVMAPAPAAPSGSLADRIAQFIQTHNWPNAGTIPTQYQSELPTVHLVEISVILDRLLQAASSYGDGAGGGGSNWPPH